MRFLLLPALSGLLALSLAVAAAPQKEAPLDRPDPAAGRYYTPFPQYPNEALRRRAEALMLVELSVDVRGRIVDARVREYVGDRALTLHAASFARTNWKAIVRTRGGRPVPYRIRVPVIFGIDNQDRVRALARQSGNPRLKAMADAQRNQAFRLP